jgi:hypothetical protein
MADTGDITLAALLDSIPRDELARMVARRGRVGQSLFLEALYFDLGSAIERLESNAHRVQSDGEEKLTNYLAVQLAAAGYDASCETDVRGHTDLKVENRSAQVVWIAESKLHSSHEKNIDGMLQLMTRYTSGRHSDAGFLLFIRQPSAALILERWRSAVQADARLACTAVGNHSHQATFSSDHDHPSGFKLFVRHHGILLFYDPQA